MYQKIVIALFTFLSLSCSDTQPEIPRTQFNNIEHYVEIKGRFTQGKEISEYFSFYCPHCFEFEPVFDELKGLFPDDVIFKKNHVDGMPGQNQAIEQALTKALITADILNIKAKIVSAIFKKIHIDRDKFDHADDVKNIFFSLGIDEAKFDEVYSSVTVETRLKEMQQQVENLRKQGIRGVPTLIVNGKYKPITNNLKSMAEYKNLISYLLNKTP